MLTPPSATAMGSPMASTDPNATMSTMIAKARPISSLWGGSSAVRLWPPASTCSPSIDGASSAISAPIAAASVVSTSADRFTWAKASSPASGPVAAIWPAPRAE